MTMPRAEVLPLVERRRRWSRVEKEQIVAASFAPGATASEVAGWDPHKPAVLLAQGALRAGRCRGAAASPVEIAPPMVVGAAGAPEPRPPLRQWRTAGLIEIDLGDGRRLRVDREVDSEALRRVLDVLDRR